MYDWIIVGGGVHGVHLAAVLRERVGVPAEAVCLLDPHEHLLAAWDRQAEAVGMAHLRSPAVHHLDLDPFDLLRFAEPLDERQPFVPPYNRPSLALFARHNARLIERLGLHAAHHRGRAVRLRPGTARVRVELEDGGLLEARRVVLAPGPPPPAAVPEALSSLRGVGRVRHLFDPGAGLGHLPRGSRFAVIGAGISGAPFALRAVRAGRDVALFTRHALRVHAFDAEPGWLGPREMAAFERTRCLRRRRAMIDAARHRGSMPEDVYRDLMHELRVGRIRLLHGELQHAATRGDELRLRGEGFEVEVDQVVLATGFARERPGEMLIERLVQEEGLAIAPCGVPLVDAALRWHPRLFVRGGLAERVLGPVARNISGARRAAARIVEFALEVTRGGGRRGGAGARGPSSASTGRLAGGSPVEQAQARPTAEALDDLRRRAAAAAAARRELG